MQTIIIYGGSFNPFHNGHAAITEYCAKLPNVDAVWLMPSAARTDKPDLAADKARLAMLQAYTESVQDTHKQVVVSDFELQLGAPSETIRTYRALRAAYPQYRFLFVFGADSVADMQNWRGASELAGELEIVVIQRHGYAMPDTSNIHAVITVPESVSGLSSTLVRQYIRAGQPIDTLVPQVVQTIIRNDKLYI